MRRLPAGAFVAPGFIDLQVNGGGGVLLNDQPTPEGIRAIAVAHRRLGTTAIVPTLISDTREKMQTAGVEPLSGAPEQFAAMIRAEIPRWRKVVTDANIKVE